MRQRISIIAPGGLGKSEWRAKLEESVRAQITDMDEWLTATQPDDFWDSLPEGQEQIAGLTTVWSASDREMQGVIANGWKWETPIWLGIIAAPRTELLYYVLPDDPREWMDRVAQKDLAAGYVWPTFYRSWQQKLLCDAQFEDFCRPKLKVSTFSHFDPARDFTALR